MCRENTLSHGSFLLALSKQEIKQPPSQLVHPVCDIPVRNPCHLASCHSGGSPREGRDWTLIRSPLLCIVGTRGKDLTVPQGSSMSNNEGAVGQF